MMAVFPLAGLSQFQKAQGEVAARTAAALLTVHEQTGASPFIGCVAVGRGPPS